MSEEPTHDTTTIRASKDGDGGGGAGKWLLGGLAAVVLLGGGYFAWKNMAPGQNNTEYAANDPYAEEPLRAGPLSPSDDDMSADNASSDDATASPASAEPQAAPRARRQNARAEVVPEETIGITPVNATAQDSDEIVVTGARRPTWARTPSARRLSALYPERALERGREGEARLHCIVEDGGALDCERTDEYPARAGFGNAALRVARTFRHAETLADGSDAVGTPVNLRVVFRIDENERRRG